MPPDLGARMQGEGARAAAHPGALIAAIVKSSLSVSASESGKKFVPQNSGCFVPWLGRCGVCSTWG